MPDPTIDQVLTPKPEARLRIYAWTPNEPPPAYAGLIKVGQTVRADVNDRIRRHALILDAIDSKLDLAADGSTLQLSDKEIQKTKEVLDGEIYTLTPKMKRTMILLRLDEMKSSGEATYDYPFITIEHVLPQTPPVGSQWCEWWPDQQIRERNVHRLGNLALLNKKQNPAAKNYEFEVKKNKYFFGKSGASPFAITTEIVSRKSWTVEDFEERQASFLKVLCEEWRLTPMAQV